MPKGPTRNIAVSESAHAALIRFCDERSISLSMRDTATQIILWFSRQPEYVQTCILQEVDTHLKQDYARMLRKLADELDGQAETTH